MTLVAAAGFDHMVKHMASREMLEDAVERLTEQLKVATTSILEVDERRFSTSTGET